MAVRVTRESLLATLLLAVCVSTTAVEATGSHIPWAEQRPFTSLVDPATVSSNHLVDVADLVSRAFRPDATQRLRNAAALKQDSCLTDFLILLGTNDSKNVSKGEQVLDATGKPGSYILQGNLHITGSFDECLDIEGFVSHYCVFPLFPLVNNHTIQRSSGQNVSFLTEVCLPRSCNASSIGLFVNELNLYLNENFSEYGVNVNYTMNDTMCEKSEGIPYNAGAKVMIVVCGIFLLLSLVGTTVDFGIQSVRGLIKKPEFSKKFKQNVESSSDSEDDAPLLSHTQPTPAANTNKNVDPFEAFEKPLEFVTAFSIIKNLSMILSTKQPPTAITSLNGIRVMSIFWVIVAHTHYWALISNVLKNPAYALSHYTHRFSYQPIVNGFLAVDSFFFLSGVLVAYLTLREMERKKGRFPVLTYYLHRYLRLTMVYAFLLFFWWTLTVHLGNGPTWRAAAGEGSDLQQNCEKYWWTNFLYINNLYPWSLADECMGWTWYLSNDMQFYILAPLIIIPLYFFFPVGLAISGALVLVTFVTNGAISGVKKLDANVLQANDPAILNDIYIKPYTRAAPYIVGLVLGFVLFKKMKIKIHWFIDWLIYRAVLLMAAGCLFSTVYGLYSSWDRGGLSLAENVSYFMFSRFVWAVGLALLVYACHNGYGRAINAFLSMGFWVPLSRLTYTAYLIHPILLTVVFGTLREPFTFTDYMMAIYAVAMVVLAFGAAGVVAVFVEFPLSNLEMAVFKVAGLKLRTSTRNVANREKDVHLETRDTNPGSPEPINK